MDAPKPPIGEFRGATSQMGLLQRWGTAASGSPSAAVADAIGSCTAVPPLPMVHKKGRALGRRIAYAQPSCSCLAEKGSVGPDDARDDVFGVLPVHLVTALALPFEIDGERCKILPLGSAAGPVGLYPRRPGRGCRNRPSSPIPPAGAVVTAAGSASASSRRVDIGIGGEHFRDTEEHDADIIEPETGIGFLGRAGAIDDVSCS